MCFEAGSCVIAELTKPGCLSVLVSQLNSLTTDKAQVLTDAFPLIGNVSFHSGSLMPFKSSVYHDLPSARTKIKSFSCVWSLYFHELYKSSWGFFLDLFKGLSFLL